MAYELQMLGWTTLFTLIAFLPASIAKRQLYGQRWLFSNRDTEGLPALTGWGARAVRAHENLKENFPAFAAAVLLLAVVGKTGGQGTEFAAALFLVARIVHMASYLAGYFWPRTIAWATGWVATLYIIFIAL